MVASKSTCEVCGNDVDDQAVRCPYCGSKRSAAAIAGIEGQWKEVNLEKGRPLVRDAVRHLKAELESARSANVKTLVLIHGYGSSGTGGAIKEAVRHELVSLLGRKKLNEVYYGEDFSKHAGITKQLIKRFPSMRDHVQRSNPGITVVVVAS